MLEVAKDLMLPIGGLATGLLGKILWDWVQTRLVNEKPKEIPVSGDTDKIQLGAARFKLSDLSDILKNNRCTAHEHMASGVSEMIVLQKEAVAESREIGRRVDEMKNDVKLMRSEFKDDFNEAFTRLRESERRIGDAEGDVKALKAQSSRVP